MTAKDFGAMNLTDTDKHIQTFSHTPKNLIFIDSFNELSIKLNYCFVAKF